MDKKFNYSMILLIALLLLVVSGCDLAVDTNVEEKVEMNMENELKYSNPFELPEEWDDYGSGDPYVLRHNGMYYLYVSTKDFRPGIKAWSSEDLINWTYEGFVTEDEITTSAYAPEVVYWNGTFYMYTSPAGQGHYVLSSESPTGPFVVRTENLGMSIDGSVFIDDDGTWYFTHAGDKGIVGHKMTDPLTFDYGVNTNVFMGHWTEGSSIIKKNDLYYMTYTGNHVFSKGYRVNYAVSEISPLEGYQIPEHNPIIINTSDDFYGLGHNSLVLGPDLNSYYAIYHNLIGRSTEGPPVRKMNIDRLVFNGKKMDVLGPTNYEMMAPRRPDFEIRKIEARNEGLWLSEKTTNSSYTAEYNFKIEKHTENGSIDLVFSYIDENNYGYASIDFSNHQLTLKQVQEGSEQVVREEPIPNEFDFTKIHTIRIENRLEKILVFLDGMRKIDVENDILKEGKIGYNVQNVNANLEYTAFSNHVSSTSDYEVFKPIPGSIEAIHYLEGKDRGYYVKELEQETIYRKDVPVQLTKDGTYSVELRDKGDWLKYKVNIKEDGLYGVSAIFNPQSTDENTKLQFSIEGGDEQTFKLPEFASDDENGQLKVHLGTMELQKGFQVLKLMLKRGNVDIERLEIYKVSEKKIDSKQVFKDIEIDDIHGAWLYTEDRYLSDVNEDMKLYYGDETWTDVEVEMKFEINDLLMNRAGLLIRATNKSNFEHQVKDSLMGYYISFNQREVALQKLNYDSTLLKSASYEFEQGKEYQLRVRVEGSEINVFIDDQKEPILTYYDPNAFMYGRVGIRSEFSDVYFNDLSIKSIHK